jgi:hypothetical protein
MVSSIAELEINFGKLITPLPTGIAACEINNFPESRIELRAETSNAIGRFFALEEAKLRIADTLLRETCLLWIVDSAGRIWLALEELIQADSPKAPRMPRIRSFPRLKSFPKLGHPSLLEGPRKSGRIAGEIVYDRGLVHPWCLTNSSGRYGLNCGGTEEQLKSVQMRFQSFGFKLGISFV